MSRAGLSGGRSAVVAGLVGLALGLILVLGVGAPLGCGSAMTPEREPHNAQALDLLRRAKALYQEAETARARGDIEGCVARLEQVAKLPFPADAPEREDVVVDALSEVSRVRLAARQPDAAVAAARRAIGRATRSSYFLGLAYLRLGDALRAQGHERDAVDALEKSISVNDQVMARLLGSPDHRRQGGTSP